MTALLGRRLDIGEQEARLKLFAKIRRRGGSLTAREIEVERLLKKLQYNRAYVGGRYVSVDDCVEGLLALEVIERTRPLTHLEAERRGELVAREQRWAASRPSRIERLREQLALLESLQLAEQGAGALDAEPAIELEMVRETGGSWSAAERRAA